MAPTIQDVKARHEAELLQLPGVVSVGIGRDTDGVLVLVVGLDRDRPETQAVVPQQLDGHRVKVQVVGQIRAR